MGELLNSITNGIYDLEAEPWNKISDEAKDLIKKLMEVDSNKRLNATSALDHPWFL